MSCATFRANPKSDKQGKNVDTTEKPMVIGWWREERLIPSARSQVPHVVRGNKPSEGVTDSVLTI